jgi:hypothetical protein
MKIGHWVKSYSRWCIHMVWWTHKPIFFLKEGIWAKNRTNMNVLAGGSPPSLLPLFVVLLSLTQPQGRGALGAMNQPPRSPIPGENPLTVSLCLCLAAGSSPSCPGRVSTIWRTIWTWGGKRQRVGGEARNSLNYYGSCHPLGELGSLQVRGTGIVNTVHRVVYRTNICR